MSAVIVNQGESCDITVKQGAQYDFSVYWSEDADGDTPISLAGYAARMDIRKAKELTSTLYLSLGSATGEIVITPANGQLDITITAAETALFTWYKAWYDIIIEQGSVIHRLLQGEINSDHGVTS